MIYCIWLTHTLQRLVVCTVVFFFLKEAFSPSFPSIRFLFFYSHALLLATVTLLIPPVSSLKKIFLIKDEKLSTEYSHLEVILWLRTVGNESGAIKFRRLRRWMSLPRWEPSPLIIFMFFLVFQFSLFSSNVGDSLCWFVSVSLLSTPGWWNSEVFMTSLYPNTSNSVYVGNLDDIPVCFILLGSFVGFFWISNFVFYTVINYSLALLFYFIFHLIPYFITSSWFKVADVFFLHINECVSLQRRA